METTQTEWTEVNPGIWKPEQIGDSIEGVLVNKAEGKGGFDSTLYFLETPTEIKGVWGSAILDERMKLLNVGERVKIEFKGVEKNKKGQPVKIFKVYRKLSA